MRLALLSLLLAAGGWLAATRLPPNGSAVVGFVLLVSVLALMARGIFSVRSGLVEPTLWRTEDIMGSRVGLSFDDGPHPEWTPRVLDALRAERVRATFFLVGENVRRHPGLARRIVAEGHEIGCHADSHSPLTPFFPPGRMGREIEASLSAIRADAGVTPRLYRPPFAARSPAHHGVARRMGLLMVGMARRGLDKTPSMTVAGLVSRLVDRARPGEILALHDGDEPGRSTGRCLTADALPGILRGLRGRGLEPIPVAALLSERPYVESPERRWSGRTRGGRFGNALFHHTVRLFGISPGYFMSACVAGWFATIRNDARDSSIALRRRLHGPAGPVTEWLWVFRHFRTYGRTLLWRLGYLMAGGAPPVVTYEGYEAVRGTVEAPGPLLLVSAHLGDWSGASRRLAVQERRNLHVVAFRGVGMGPHQVKSTAGDAKFRVIDVASSPEDLALAMTAALGAGDAVAIHADRVMDEAHAVRVPFLGKEALFPRGVWNVAMVTGAPAIVYFAVPTAPDRVEMRCYGPIRVPRVPREGREAAVAAAAREFAGHLEECLRRHPFHWGNFYDFWRP